MKHSHLLFCNVSEILWCTNKHIDVVTFRILHSQKLPYTGINANKWIDIATTEQYGGPPWAFGDIGQFPTSGKNRKI